jgi:RepB DNA-primase from phage plasmid
MNGSPSNEAFIIAAFRACTACEAPWVAGFPGDPAQADRRHWGGRPILRGIPHFIRPANNNYVCVSTFRREVDGEWRRRKASFAAMHVVMIDDIGTKVPETRIALEPSVLVETSPGNCQAWYFLDPPEADASRADLVLKRMIAAGLSVDAKDPGMRGVTRYGRLPVGCNGKAAYVKALGAPFVQRVESWNPTRYVSLDDIAEAYNLDLSPEPPRRYVVRPSTESSDSLVPRIADYGLYLGPLASVDGAHQIVCPWLHEHTGGDSTGTVYFEPAEPNGWRGGFKCHHGHCMDRGIKELERFVRAAERITKGRKAA